MRFFQFLPPVFLAVVLISILGNYSRQTPALEAARPDLHCTLPPTFRIGYQRDVDGVIPQGQGFRFQGVSWLETDVCTAGILEVKADGEMADQQEPTLTINLNPVSLANVNFSAKEKTIRVRIPHAGRLTVGYFNDYYLAEVRIATLEKFKFSSPTCQTFEVDVPRATGGSWQPEYNSATLVSNVAMTVTPCAAGELSLHVVGRAGLKVFPMLVFQQDGKTLVKLTTTQNYQRVKLDLSAAPLTIQITNPYGRTVADRNLNVRSLTFTPDAPKSP